MKIGIVSPYADPEKGAAVVRVNSFRDYFMEKGHEVTVFSPLRNNIPVDGVVRYDGVMKLMSNMYKKNLDIIVGTSPPITHNLFVLMVAMLKGTPFILDSKDPFSYLVSRFAHMKKGRFKMFLYRAMEAIVHRGASHIFVLTPRDKVNVEKWYSLAGRKVTVIRNGSDISVIKKDQKAGNRVRKVLSIPAGKKLLIYAGVIGGKDLDILLEQCKSVIEKHDLHILFLFTHDGSSHADAMHQKIQEVIRKFSFEKRVHIVVNTSYQDLYRFLSAADLAMSPVPDFWETNLPTKVFDYLAAEITVIAKGPKEGSMKEFFDKYHVGYFSSDWQGFSHNMEKALNDPSRKKMGKEGREVIKKYFSRKIFNEQALEIIEGMVKK